MTSKPSSKNGQKELSIWPCPTHEKRGMPAIPTYLQLSFRDKDPNDFIGPFPCPAGAVAHAMLYGPPFARIVVPEKAPQYAHCMNPADHRNMIYARQRGGKVFGQPDPIPAVIPDAAETPEMAESADPA
jgi:hypothetical protein